MISIIVAQDKNGGIGKDNKLLCHLPTDLKRFRSITKDSHIVMGNNTYLSLPNGALDHRVNIVLSRNINIEHKHCIVVDSIQKVLDILPEHKESFVIGGSNVYNQFFSFTDKIYLTEIDHTFDADVFFPKIDYSEWRIILEEDIIDKYNYKFKILERL